MQDLSVCFSGLSLDCYLKLWVAFQRSRVLTCIWRNVSVLVLQQEVPCSSLQHKRWRMESQDELCTTFLQRTSVLCVFIASIITHLVLVARVSSVRPFPSWYPVSHQNGTPCILCVFALGIWIILQRLVVKLLVHLMTINARFFFRISSFFVWFLVRNCINLDSIVFMKCSFFFFF